MNKISIKREQSQAGLSFAEREKFRPQVKNKLLLLLALLMTAATGAWADTTVTWSASDMSQIYIDFDEGTAQNNTIKGITATGSTGGDGRWDGDNISAMNAINTITFTSSVGNIKSIAIKAETISLYPQGGWTLSDENKKLSWSGEASSTVSLTLSAWDEIDNISEIVFTIESAPAPAAATYTVSLKDGVKDADKWTVKVGEGQAQALPIGGLKGDGSETVTLQYNGRLKVKGVKATSDAAPAVKPAATVTTAPTAKSGVKAGEDVAIVTAGVATGGTMMYKVTTANTKPTSTEGFSATVPTAKTLAAGTFYVWYYVKADATHTDSEISATAIAVTVKARSANGQLDDPDDYLIEDDPFNF